MTFPRISLMLLCASIALPLAQANAQEKISGYQNIKDLYLTGFASTATPAQPLYEPEKSIVEQLRFRLEELNPLILNTLAIDMLIQHGTLHNDTTIINGTFIKKMQLCNQENGVHLISQLNPRGLSTFGGIGFANILLNPTMNCAEIATRQKTILALSEMLQQKATAEQVGKLFETFKDAEANILRYWHAQLPLNANITSGFYYAAPFIPKTFNKSTTALEIGMQQRYAMMPYVYSQSVLAPAFLISTLMEQAKQNKTPGAEPLGMFTLIKQSVMNLSENLRFCGNSWSTLDTKTKAKVAITAPILGTIMYFMTKINHAAYGLQNDLVRHYQARLMSVKKAVHVARKLHTTLSTDATTAQLAAVQQLKKFFKGDTHSKNFSKLLRMLETNTFEGKPSLLSITGRVLAAHKLLDETKNELIPLLEAVGSLEAYYAAAQLYSSNQGKPARFCFAEFVDNTSPSIAMTNFWNPFISAETVVTNNVQFNDGTQRNVILTGPNTAGKSTVIKAVALNILLAQTFGICAADSVRITPFSKLNCHMNITDDIARGQSLFQAELTEARELAKDVQSLAKDQFCFTIMDELFNGTNAEGGTKAAYDFSEKLAQYNNLILVVATHFDKLTTLDKVANFKNMYIGAHLDEQGALVRPFKLQDGIFHDPENKILHALLDREGLFDSAAPAA